MRTSHGVVVYNEDNGASIFRAADEVCTMDLSRGEFETEIVEAFMDNASHADDAMALAERMITEEGMGQVVVYNTTRDNQGEFARFTEDGNGGARRMW